jgi:hypothetical protein
MSSSATKLEGSEAGDDFDELAFTKVGYVVDPSTGDLVPRDPDPALQKRYEDFLRGILEAPEPSQKERRLRLINLGCPPLMAKRV